MPKDTFTFKFMFIGDSSTGKSNLLLRYSHGAHYKWTDKYIPSIGMDYIAANLNINGKTVKTLVWDYESPRRKYDNFRWLEHANPHAVILTVDLTDRESFNNLDRWMAEINRYTSDNTQIILVGTKSDKTPVVQQSEIDRWLANNPSVRRYFATSAKTGHGVQEAFTETSKLIMDEMSISNAFKTDSARSKIYKKLEHYIARIDNNKLEGSNSPNFSSGFWFFKESRALNRNANYLLAKKLMSELKNTDTPTSEIFSDENIKNLRLDMVESARLNRNKAYVDRGINSNELNGIIKETRNLVSDDKPRSKPR